MPEFHYIYDMTSWEVEHRTGIGRRHNNEDRILCRIFDNQRILLAVCDGMGDQMHGGTAAELAIRTLKIFSFSNIFGRDDSGYCKKLINHIEQTFSAFINEKPSYQGMGTTLALTYLEKDKACLLWIGDSRIYLLRDNGIKFISEDHNLASQLLKSGKIHKNSLAYNHNKNILTNCIMGNHRPTGFDFETINSVHKGDVFFLCTDGLTDVISNTTIESTLAGMSIKEAALYFEEECRTRSNDNYSFILLKTI